MQKLRGSPHIIVLLFYFLCLWNQVTGFCPSQCTCNDNILRVSCDSANLVFVPITLNPELKELRLSNNNISALKESLNVYRILEYLNVSANDIENVEKGNFKEQNYLKSLDLSSNKISLLYEDAFLGLNSLKELYLAENFLVNLSSNIFTHLENLELLDISQNVVEFIDGKAFFGLKNLKTLSLRENELTFIPTDSFQHISHILNLDLGQNFFQTIPANSFSFLTHLRKLILDRCGINIIMYGAFKGLDSLLVLHIHNNEINAIPTKAFFDIFNLKELNVGQNTFSSIKPKAFQGLKNLNTLDISGCKFLEYINENVFSDNPNLKSIIISQNRALRHIQDGAFDNNPQIRHVNFQGNAFETFQHTLLPWAELVSLDVRDNPLVCNCSLLWLWKLLVTKNYSSIDGSSDTTQVVCVNPPELKDTVLPNLQEVDLDCYTLDARRQVVIGIILGGALASAAIVMIGFRYRDKLAGALKTKWRYGRKEPQYQKTCAEEESTILHAAHQSLKLTPVTEL